MTNALTNIPVAQPLSYDSVRHVWCYGCGCNGKRSCYAIPEDAMVVPTSYGAHVLGGKRHHFQRGYIAVCADAQAAAEAVARQIARRLTQADFGLPAMRAF